MKSDREKDRPGSCWPCLISIILCVLVLLVLSIIHRVRANIEHQHNSNIKRYELDLDSAKKHKMEIKRIVNKVSRESRYGDVSGKIKKSRKK